MEMRKPSEVQRMESLNAPVKKEEPKNLNENIYSVFKNLHSKFFLNNSLFYGRDAVKNLFQSKSKVISAPCMPILNELKSFVQNNTRMPTLFSYNKTIEQRFIDIFNEILINSYSANEVNKHLIDAWNDFMINGLGILKLTGDFDTCISPEVIPPNSVVFDYANIEEPQFFIQEKIMSTDSACKEYDIDQEAFMEVLGNPSNPKIICSSSSWDNLVNREFASSAEGKAIKVKTIQDIFSQDFVSKIVYEKPSTGLNVIREEYKRAYTKTDKEILEIYERNVFVNDRFVSSTNINTENFPFILLHNYKRDTLTLEEAFPCFLDQVKGDILLFNNLSCLQLDGVTSSAAGSSLVIMDSNLTLDSSNKNNKPSSSLNMLNVKSGIDKGINDVVTKTPPIDISQSIQNEMQLCLNRMKSSTGLMNFETPVKSGFQESLRLDREMSNISYWLTTVDSAIIKIGRLIKNILTRMLNVEVAPLKQFVGNPYELDADMCKILIKVAKQSINGIAENKDAFTYKNKVINDLIRLRDITGTPIEFDLKEIAKCLNMPQEVIDTISSNAPDPVVSQIEMSEKISEIEKNKASAIKDEAMAKKYLSEAKTEEKNLKNNSK